MFDVAHRSLTLSHSLRPRTCGGVPFGASVRRDRKGILSPRFGRAEFPRSLHPQEEDTWRRALFRGGSNCRSRVGDGPRDVDCHCGCNGSLPARGRPGPPTGRICAESTLRGDYGLLASGVRKLPPALGVGSEHFVATALWTFHGDGTFTQRTGAALHGEIAGVAGTKCE